MGAAGRGEVGEGKVTFSPFIDKRTGAPSFKVQIPLFAAPLWSGILPAAVQNSPKDMASQVPPSWNQIVTFLKDMEKLRASGLSAA